MLWCVVLWCAVVLCVVVWCVVLYCAVLCCAVLCCVVLCCVVLCCVVLCCVELPRTVVQKHVLLFSNAREVFKQFEPCIQYMQTSRAPSSSYITVRAQVYVPFLRESGRRETQRHAVFLRVLVATVPFRRFGPPARQAHVVNQQLLSERARQRWLDLPDGQLAPMDPF